MMGPWLQYNPRYVELCMREILAQAEQDRLGRRVRVGRPLRHRVGMLLIATGEALAGPAFVAGSADEHPYHRQAPA
jgi:hypothetical protein